MLTDVSREHKDRVFRFIFGSPENKAWTLSLYNAVNGSCYHDPDEIQFNTLEDVLYMGMKNDVSFIVRSEMNLWEHQSSFNPNMPMRFLSYGTQLYEQYIATNDYYEYSSRLQPLPKPNCICFYNGKADQSERQVLKLSEAFGGEADIEVKVTMLNINYGKNKGLMDACRPLREYAWLVETIRINQREMQDFEAAVDAAINVMPEDFAIWEFLIANRAGVKRMFLKEYDEEKMKAQERREAENEVRETVATEMLKEKMPIELIKKISKLSDEHIRKLADSIGVAVL